MFRRCLSVLLIAAFLAGQLAVVPCAHAGMSAVERQQHVRPHFHWGAGHRGHTHDHTHHGHTHRRHTHHRSPSSDELQSLAVAGQSSGTDHDGDALYLTTGFGVFAPLTKLKVAGATELVWAADAACADAVSCFSVRRNTFVGRRTSQAALDGSGLYLRLRTLRI